MKTLTFFFSILVSLQFVNAGSFEDRHNHQLYYTAPCLLYTSNYVLPLLLAGTSFEAIDVDPTKNTCLLGVSYVPDAESLTSIHLGENMIS